MAWETLLLMKSDLGEDGIIRYLKGESARETRLSLFWVKAQLALTTSWDRVTSHIPTSGYC